METVGDAGVIHQADAGDAAYDFVVDDVSKVFAGATRVQALSNIDLRLKRGSFTCIVGPSGCGKSTLLRIIGELETATKGTVQINVPQSKTPRSAFVFQEHGVFPWFTVLQNVAFGQQMASVGKKEREQNARRWIAEVGLTGFEHSYPHQLSGGMRQRVAIAIALLNSPRLIIADEPTTALDVTIQGQILFEVQKLCRETGTALIWITHDLAVVAGLADRVAVMYAGRVVETGSTADVIGHPMHPYTHGLIASIPTPESRGRPLMQIPGMTPSLLNLPRGCAFRGRCPRATDACLAEPQPEQVRPGQWVRCWHAGGPRNP